MPVFSLRYFGPVSYKGQSMPLMSHAYFVTGPRTIVQMQPWFSPIPKLATDLMCNFFTGVLADYCPKGYTFGLKSECFKLVRGYNVSKTNKGINWHICWALIFSSQSLAQAEEGLQAPRQEWPSLQGQIKVQREEQGLRDPGLPRRIACEGGCFRGKSI